MFWGTFDFEAPAFEWGADYQRPNLPPQDLIVYEMPVRSFTADASSKVGDANQGTFKGVAEKVYLGAHVLVRQSLLALCQLRMERRVGIVGHTLYIYRKQLAVR